MTYSTPELLLVGAAQALVLGNLPDNVVHDGFDFSSDAVELW